MTMAGTREYIHPQLLDLAGQGIAPPAQQHRRIATSPGRVLERRLYHDPFEAGHGTVEQVRLTACQRLVSPLTQRLLPVGDRGCILRQIQQFRR